MQTKLTKEIVRSAIKILKQQDTFTSIEKIWNITKGSKQIIAQLRNEIENEIEIEDEIEIIEDETIRSANIQRNTHETQIDIKINLDGDGKSNFDIGIPFLEHMLEQVAKHGIIDLDIKAKGDLHIDGHHTVEDIGITLGKAFQQALGDKKGICRYGHAYVPLDESLSRVVLDFSGRPGLEFHADFPRAAIGNFETDLFHEFFQGFANHALVTLHIDNLRGQNSHHIAESIFKAFGRAIRMAIDLEPRILNSIPSTKGSL